METQEFELWEEPRERGEMVGTAEVSPWLGKVPGEENLRCPFGFAAPSLGQD